MKNKFKDLNPVGQCAIIFFCINATIAVLCCFVPRAWPLLVASCTVTHATFIALGDI